MAVQPKHRQAENQLPRRLQERLRHLVCVHPGPAGENKRHATIDRERTKCDDDRRDVELPDKKAIDSAEYGSDADRYEDDQYKWKLRITRIQHAYRHAGERHIRRNRQINGFRQDHRHLPKRKNDQNGRVVEYVGEVARSCEARRARRERGEQNGYDDHQQHLATFE